MLEISASDLIPLHQNSNLLEGMILSLKMEAESRAASA
jgi:hypothetical protein